LTNALKFVILLLEFKPA